LIQNCHVCVVGIGGVGSWVVESLVRHGVGKITLIDMDHIVESNINRQIHALDSTDGESKIKAMKIESLISIQPAWWIVLMIF
jgi:tRNA A37 threonylcarbamoyladenosine dehydratase